jgi:acyl dehydratase
MNLDEYFGIGGAITLGSHRFEPDEIKAFAAKYDPQPFHLDEKAAEKSVFGRLCASGWHTAATWMKYNLKKRQDSEPKRWQGPGPIPVFGPSPGFKNLKWLKPVYAGETVTFTRTCLSHRPVASRPGWRLLSIRAEAFDSAGDKVIEFESAVLVQVEFPAAG